MNSGLRKLSRRQTEPYFHGNHITTEGNKFIAWIDLMGVQDALEHGYESPAIWRGELLAAIHRHINSTKAEVFCVGDGVVFMTDDEAYRDSFLQVLFGYYVDFNLERYGDWDIFLHRLIRAGTGSGRVHKVDEDVFEEDHNEGSPFPDQFRNEPFGPGVIQAFNTEGGAPFSIQKPDATGGTEQFQWWRDEWEFDFVIENKKKAVLELLSEYFHHYDEDDNYAYDPFHPEREHDTAAMDFFEGYGVDVDLGPNC